MAISVDTIYQRVLALANKEQRGYITPQEYNLLANHAQMAIFESYFYDKNQRNRIEDARSIEVDETDISELLDRKLAPFQSYEAVDGGHTFPSVVAISNVDYDVFQTGVVLLGDEPCQKVSMFEAQRFRKSIRHMAVTDNQAPFYTDNRVSGRDIVVYAGGINGSDDNEETAGVTVECFRVPKTAAWGYVVVNGKALYNSATSVNFELHRSEEDTLTNKILELAGIIMNKVGLVTTIGQYSAAETTSQKS
jgi:hypothetical protein